MDKRLIITSGDVTFVRKRRDGAVSINISKNITQIIDLLSGKGGMEQLDSAGKVSMLVSAPLPPVITSPACNGIQTTMDPNSVFRYTQSLFSQDNNHQLGNCLLGRWWLGQRGGERVPR